MPTNDEIVNKMNWTMASEVIKDGKGLVSIRLNLNAMLNQARAEGYKAGQADLFKELEDELNKKLNNQHFRTTDFKFIAGYREAIKEAIQALKSSKGIE